MPANRILIPDNLHINKRNFASFFSFVESIDADLHIVPDKKDLVTAFGHYEDQPHLKKYGLFREYRISTLIGLTNHGINLFDVARAEILTRLIVNPEWYDNPIPQCRTEFFEKVYYNNREILVSCMATAQYWIDFWVKFLEANKKFTHCCVFSGSLIYQRTLIEVLKATPTRVLVMESCFTGNDYYCEEKYEPISNRCDLKHDTIFNSIELPQDRSEYEKERNKAINKIAAAKNKNVTQPLKGKDLNFKRKRKTVLILGQVVNDFSLLETGPLGISSIHFYKVLIKELLKRNFNIIFKAHPWEEKKSNVRHALTKSVLDQFVRNFSIKEQQKIRVLDNYPITTLFNLSDYVIGLNSQGMMEAVLCGLKPIQFGDAFFGRRGFTHDFDRNSVHEFVEALHSGEINGTLTLEEFADFERFAVKFFQHHLVSIHPSGVDKLKQIFQLPNNIPVSSDIFRHPRKPITNSVHRSKSDQSTVGSMRFFKFGRLLLKNLGKSKILLKTR
ncbi:MAG: capsular biosynthesis protein [Proteobacteria bacterium]|nr:capsular biosynthesis protein [Pseudomonadota bacterium]